MIRHNKNKVFYQTEKKSTFQKNWMIRFTKPDVPVFSQCVVHISVLLNQVQQN
jgi:hypothetical protein